MLRLKYPPENGMQRKKQTGSLQERIRAKFAAP